MVDLALVLKGLVYVVFGVAALLGNGPIRWLLRHVDPPEQRAAGTPQLLDSKRALPGGRWIGILERAGTYGCIVTGYGVGLALIVAVKGLGRYPELRARDDPRVGELFIIGTFASLLWAAANAGLAVLVTGLW